MVENEQKLSDVELQKQKIRDRYKGVDPDILEVIPATKKQVDFYDEEPKRVAVYVRVSTDDPRQTSSFELQKNYYEDFVQRYPTWTLVDIYADEGISGTSLNHRDSFNRMIADAKAGKMDIIITKSVSRFARNIVDCVQIVRDLTALPKPVGVFFETEHIYTLNDNTEMSLSFIATMAQEESHVKSSIMNASIEMRFSHGILLTPVLLGYDHDEDGNLVINEEEAQTVQLIFFMYLYGYSCQKIAETLVTLGRKTKRGKVQWTPTTVLGVLRNERHCGDVLSRKTFTPSYLDHKSKKNEGDRPQYRFRDHHDAIISREDFIAVQRMIDNAKYGDQTILPKLQVIPNGSFTGFVSINQKWSAFTAQDYRNASASVASADNIPQPVATIQAGTFNYSGFELARAQFFDDGQPRLSILLAKDKLTVSIGCIAALQGMKHGEMLVHPDKQLLALRPSDGKGKHAMKLARITESGGLKPRIAYGLAFLPTLFELFGWNTNYRYRLQGYEISDGNSKAIVFNTAEPEVLIPKAMIDTDDDKPGLASIAHDHKDIIAYPETWSGNFGKDYYSVRYGNQLDAGGIGKDLMAMATVPYAAESGLNFTELPELEQNIHSLISMMKERVNN